MAAKMNKQEISRMKLSFSTIFKTDEFFIQETSERIIIVET